MRLLLVLCVIGLAGTALAKPGMIRERMSREFRNVKSGGGFKPPLHPLHMIRNQLSKSMKSASHRKKMGCELCPPANAMKPCSCECECNTTPCSASIYCDSALETRTELNRILSLPNYPVSNYSRLVVEKTSLNQSIDEYLLGSAISFKEININHNGFDSVSTNAFSNSRPTIEKLILNDNKIGYIQDWSILEDMPNIEHIDISNNKLEFIPRDMMNSKHLRYLNLSNNTLLYAGSFTFRGLSRLNHLDLSHNALPMLKSDFLAFEDHEDTLIWINLSHNQIASVQSHAISGVKIVILDLRFNQLLTLNEEIFRNLIDSTDASIHVDVTGNPIECGCHLLWVVQNSTVSNCFDDFPVCNTTIKNATTENLGDCTLNNTTTNY